VTAGQRVEVTPDVLARAEAAYLGLALGDALGATVEFMTPREIAHHFAHAGGVHREIIGGGWLNLRPGRSPTTPAWPGAGRGHLAHHGGMSRQALRATLSTPGCAASRWTSAIRCGAT
jgi:hypothetical protein